MRARRRASATSGAGRVVGPADQRHRDERGGRQAVPRGQHRPDQRLRGQAVRAGLTDRHQHEHVAGDGARGVGDLGQLGPVQRPVGVDREHPAVRGDGLADLRWREPEVTERAAEALADAAHRTADADEAARLGGERPPFLGRPTRGRPAVGDRPDVDHVHGGQRRPFGIGEHERPPQGVGQVQALDHRGGDAQRDRHRPGRAVGQATASGDRFEVGPGRQAGQRRQRAGEKKLQVRELARTWRVGGSLAQHIIRQRPPCHPV